MKTCKRWPNPAPEPGIYPNTPAAEYHSWAAINASVLKEVAKSPLTAWYWLNQEADLPNGALHNGTCMHAAILEPEMLQAAPICPDKVVFPGTGRERTLSPSSQCDGETWAIAVAEHGPLCHTAAMRANYDRWIRVVEKSGELKDLVYAKDALREVAIVWENPKFPGVRMKARLDLVVFREDGEVEIPDVKTTAQATEDDFIRQCWNLGYPEQFWHYRVAAHAAHEFDPRFPAWTEQRRLHSSVIALYEGPPRDAVLYELPDSELTLCQHRHSELMIQFLTAYVTGRWPGRGGGKRQGLVWLPWMHARYQGGGMT